MQADINDVRRGIGHDRRIGFAFLFPGVGYGGSCFPKDIRAMIAMGRDHKESMKILSAVDAVNQRQKTVLMRPIELHFDGQLEGKRIALWGLSFKPQTDDIREAPALEMIEQLLQRGASLSVHDPEALNNVRKIYGERLTYEQRPADCLRDADALLINTEWGEFRHPDLDEVKQLMKHPVVFDGRNLFEPEKMAAAGFKYYSIGRAAV
jgi:UDPglucose 6-dehydrogenase